MIDGSRKGNMINKLQNFKPKTMKSKIAIIVFALFTFVNASFAQQDEECMTNLTIFNDAVKSKKYDQAFEPWMKVRNKCPKFNIAIYAYGEKILKHKIKNSTGAEQVAFINDLLKLWEDRAEYYPSKTKKGEYMAKACQLMYDNREALGKSKAELYECFDIAYKADTATFTNPKSLYTYFSLLVDIYNEGKTEIQDVFNKYDDVSEKLDSEVKNYSQKLNILIEKEEAGTALTSKESKYKKSYNSYLSAYDKVAGSIDSKLGKLANCENLIPLYEKDFEEFKNDGVWLKRAVTRMANKECTDSPLYIKLVKAYDETAPSADTKYYVGTLLDREGKSNEAIKYYNQSIDLETDSYQKAKLLRRIGLKLKSRKSYSQARSYFRKALKENPSMGENHLSIAAMYAASANSCGDTTFNKRAVYWLAAQEARKAGRVNAKFKKSAAQSSTSYEAKAPSRSDIFSAGNSGTTINIGCWINESVKVPSL